MEGWEDRNRYELPRPEGMELNTGTVAQRGSGISTCGDFQNRAGQGPEQAGVTSVLALL